MRIGGGSVPNAEKIANEALLMMRDYNFYGKMLYDAIKASGLEIFILDESWCERQGNRDMKQFRGYAKEKEIVMFFTRFETEESMKWLLLHEIGHWALMQSIGCMSFMSIARQKHYQNKGMCNGNDTMYYNQQGFQEEYRKDAVHDSDPEEHLANIFADGVMGASYGRPWWRKRIAEVENGA